jgi:hypothetical protein
LLAPPYGIYTLEDPNVTLEDPGEMQVALENPSAGCKCSFALKGPLRSRAGSAAYAGKSTGGRDDDDQDDGLVELPEELTDTGDPRAGESLDPRQAQLNTELDDDGESSGERSDADEGSGKRSRRARARGHSCGRLST